MQNVSFISLILRASICPLTTGYESSGRHVRDPIQFVVDGRRNAKDGSDLRLRLRLWTLGLRTIGLMSLELQTLGLETLSLKTLSLEPLSLKTLSLEPLSVRPGATRPQELVQEHVSRSVQGVHARQRISTSALLVVPLRPLVSGSVRVPSSLCSPLLANSGPLNGSVTPGAS
jgi:hypothetical protein